MNDELRDRMARKLYIESSEAEDGDVVWESPEAIAEEIEGWGRFAQAIIDEFGLTVEAPTGFGITQQRVVGKWERND